jgi:hypothetical protein
VKLFLMAAAFLGVTFALSATDASAAVCARGVYGAGCAGPRGVVVARRPVARVVPPRVVTPRVVCAAARAW